MSDFLDVEPILDDWLTEGVDIWPDRSIDAVLATVQRTSQRRAWRAPWRTSDMTGIPRMAAILGAAALVALLVGGLSLVGGQRAPTAPTLAPAAVATATASIASATAATVPSPRPSLGVDAPGTIVFLQHDAATDSDLAYAMAADGSARRQLGDGPACCLTLSPSGAEVLMGRGDPPTPVIIGLGGRSSASPWSPVAGLNLAPAAWSVGDDTKAFQGWDDAHPARDGIWLSVGRGARSNIERLATGALWGEARQLTTSPAGLEDIPIAFAYREQLVFVRGREGRGDLYTIGIDGKGLTRLNPPGTFVYADGFLGKGASAEPGWSRVAFAATPTGTNGNARSSVMVVDTMGGVPTTVAGPGRWITSARWSPDGRWIAFDQDDGSGRHDTWIVAPDGSGLRNLTAGFAPGTCCAQWSPDSRFLLAMGTRSDDAHNDLYAIPLDGSTPSRLTDDPGVYTSYAWTLVSDRTP